MNEVCRSLTFIWLDIEGLERARRISSAHLLFIFVRMNVHFRTIPITQRLQTSSMEFLYETPKNTWTHWLNMLAELHKRIGLSCTECMKLILWTPHELGKNPSNDDLMKTPMRKVNKCKAKNPWWSPSFGKRNVISEHKRKLVSQLFFYLLFDENTSIKLIASLLHDWWKSI